VHPWLVYTDTFRLPTYFTLLMLGLALATFVLRREALRHDLPARLPMDAALWVLPAALIGARLVHVVVEQPGYYAAHPLHVLSPQGGWVFYGGLAGALLAGWRFSARWAGTEARPTFWGLADVFAPATAFGLVFGRIGCLGGGCCYGRPADWPLGTDVPWAVAYHWRGQVPEELLAVPLHPAPLYEALGCLGLFAWLSSVASQRRFEGQVLLSFVAGYGLLRSLVEAFRADEARGLWLGGWLSTSQIVGLVTAGLAIALHQRWLSACTPSSSRSPAPPSTPTG
jgi:phosphatidylglycerol:prolipoprotein diacylglycerol transferase